MRLAAGLTLSGIVGFLVLEVLKLILPALAAGTLGLLAIAFKILLVGVALMLGLAVVGVAVFLLARSRRARTEV